jgi:hypothetical protein
LTSIWDKSKEKKRHHFRRDWKIGPPWNRLYSKKIHWRIQYLLQAKR